MAAQAACYTLLPHANFTLAGVDDGKSCFCGSAADVGKAGSQARIVNKAQCTGTPCEGDAKETECGGPGRLLVYQYSCDPRLAALPFTTKRTHGPFGGADRFDSAHNPSLSYAMRIDV